MFRKGIFCKPLFEDPESLSFYLLRPPPGSLPPPSGLVTRAPGCPSAAQEARSHFTTCAEGAQTFCPSGSSVREGLHLFCWRKAGAPSKLLYLLVSAFGETKREMRATQPNTVENFR